MTTSKTSNTHSAPVDTNEANAWVRFGPIFFVLLPLVGVDAIYRVSMMICQNIMDAIEASLLLPTTTPGLVPAVLMASFLSGISNKMTDLIDDEGFLARHKGSLWLLVVQIFFKVLFPGFFVLMFAYNVYAAAILAATYFFAWVIRGKVGQPSKPLENVICLAFLPVAWSLVGGSLFLMNDDIDYRHRYFCLTFITVLAAHAYWLRFMKRNHQFLVQQYPYVNLLMTDIGMFRYLPVLVMACGSIAVGGTAVGREMAMGAIIVVLDNLGYFLTKSPWRKFGVSAQKDQQETSASLDHGTPNDSLLHFI